MTNIALIGVSGYGASHLRLIREQEAAGNAHLIAATVINREEMEVTCRELEDAGCVIHSDYRDMLREHGEDIDLCCIPTGIHWHAPMSIDALDAGAHVLVEKPLAATMQEVAAIIAARERNGKFVAVGFQNIYNPSLQALKKALLDGVIGRLKNLKTLGFFARTKTYYARNNWAGRLKSGEHWVLDSPANNALAHPYSLMLFLAGENFEQCSTPVGMQAEMYRSKPIESFDTVSVRVTTANDVSINFLVTHSCPESRDTEIEIEGEKGRITYSAKGGIHLHGLNGESRRMSEFDIPGADTKTPMMAAVLAKTKDAATFVCTPEIAGMHTHCINAMHEHFPIHQIPDEYIENDEDLITLSGIESIMRDAFDRNCLLSELGTVPWSRPTQPVSLKGYEAFTGTIAPDPAHG